MLVAIDMNFTCHISGQSTLSLIPGDGSASVGATESPPSGPVGPVVEAGPAASNAVHRLRRMGAATAGATAGTAFGSLLRALHRGERGRGWWLCQNLDLLRFHHMRSPQASTGSLDWNSRV